MDPAGTAPTWYWRIEPGKLREAAEIRRRDPNDFSSAVLTFFGFGGRDDGAAIAKMRAHPEGRRVLDERIPLPEGVLRPELYASLPEDTLGHQYWKHCRENGLDPMLISTQSQAVAKRYPATPDHAFVYDRYRDSHDLWHVLTGYGTDMAGEAGIVAWTWAQLRNRGYLLIFMLNATMCSKRGRFDVWKTCWHGARHGLRSPFLLAVDWRRHMERPIDDVRRDLGLEVARPYPKFDMPDAPGAPPAREVSA